LLSASLCSGAGKIVKELIKNVELISALSNRWASSSAELLENKEGFNDSYDSLSGGLS